MTAIWQNDGTGWHLLIPTGFPAEAELHRLIAENPQLLPLAGSPDLVVVGTEVALGGGYADILALESTGRPVVLEVKLAVNAEARRAVVAQVLAYAAYLYGLAPESLETQVLGGHLVKRGYAGLAEAVEANDQTGSFDRENFTETLSASLATGSFRLVIVLDSAPPELVTLVGYLEAVAQELTIDLVTVSAYEVGGSRILVPQRVEPERALTPGSGRPPTPPPNQLLPGGEAFCASIADAPPDNQATLRRLYDWAAFLEREGLCQLFTSRGKMGTTLFPYIPGYRGGLVTILNSASVVSLYVWRSIFERSAPESIERIEALLAPTPLGQGNRVAQVTEELLAAIADAYREAAGPLRSEPETEGR